MKLKTQAVDVPAYNMDANKQMTVKTLVCGSRGIDSYDTLIRAISGSPFDVRYIIHGGAKGVDSNADRYAAINDIETKVVEPNYNVYGNEAPLKRNQAMVEMADTVIAIWDGESSGTKDTIMKAKDEGMVEFGRVNYSDKVGVIYLGYEEVIN